MKNNQFINILFNIVLPLIILTRFSKEEYLGPVWGLVIALLFPVIMGLYEFIVLKQKSLLSIIGFCGILLSGGMGLLKFPPHWFAVKEAAIPLIIGAVILISTNKSWQLITKLLFNKEFFDIDAIQKRLSLFGQKEQMDKVLSKANVYLSLSFLISAILNYVLAKIVVKSMPGTIEFNEELGRMTMLSFPVIALPSVIIMVYIFKYMMSSLESMTQLSRQEMLSAKLRGGR